MTGVVGFYSRYLIKLRKRAIRKMTMPTRIATTPIRAGNPCTEPVRLTDQALKESPALTPALPFHLDQSETNPTTERTAEERNS